MEFLGEGLGEENGQFGVVDELNISHAQVGTYGNTEVYCCSSRCVVRVKGAETSATFHIQHARLTLQLETWQC